MNPSETQPNPPAGAIVQDLQEELRSLRAIVVMSLLVLNVLSGSLYIFLHNQTSLMTLKAETTEQDVAKFRAHFDPIAREFWVQLSLFAKTHPDFNPVLDKYRPYVAKAFPVAAKPAAPPAK